MENKISIMYDVHKLTAQSGDGNFSIPYDTSKYKDPSKLRCFATITKGKREYYHMGLNMSTPVISNGRINFSVKEKYLKSEYNYATGSQMPGGLFNGATTISHVLNTYEPTLVVFTASGIHFALNTPQHYIDVGLKLNGNPLPLDMYAKAYFVIFYYMPYALSYFMVNSPCTLTADVWGGSEPSYRNLSSFNYNGLVLREKGYSCTVDVMLMEVS